MDSYTHTLTHSHAHTHTHMHTHTHTHMHTHISTVCSLAQIQKPYSNNISYVGYVCMCMCVCACVDVAVFYCSGRPPETSPNSLHHLCSHGNKIHPRHCWSVRLQGKWVNMFRRIKWDVVLLFLSCLLWCPTCRIIWKVFRWQGKR